MGDWTQLPSAPQNSFCARSVRPAGLRLPTPIVDEFTEVVRGKNGVTGIANKSSQQKDPSQLTDTNCGTVQYWMLIGLALTPVVLQATLVAERLWDWVPVWAWYPDPGYVYLLAGGQIITGGTPHHNDHPGTSAQWLVGLIEALIHTAIGNGSLRSDLVQRPELYARGVGAVLGLFFVLSLGFTGLRLLRSLGIVPSLTFQLLVFWGLPVLDVARYRIMPETLVLTAAILSIGLLAPRMGDPKQPLPTGVVVSLGIVSSIGITAKVLFLPMLLVSLALLGRRQIVLYVLTGFATTVLILVPIYSRLDYMRSWFSGILLNPGRQGQPGEARNLANSIQDSVNLMNLSVRWFTLVALASLVTALVGIVLQRRITGNWQWRGQVALGLAFALVMFAAVKDAETRDFLLAFPLLAAINALGLYMILRSAPPRKWRLFVSAAAVLVASFLGLHGYVGTHYNHQIQLSRLQPILQLQDQLQRATQSVSWGLGYNVWTEQNAIMFALPWLNGAYDVEMNAESPNALYFDIWSRVFVGTTGTGTLHILSCGEVQQRVGSTGIGVIVETSNHLDFDATGLAFNIGDGKAVFRKNHHVGPFSAYQLTRVECARQADDDS